MTTTAQRIVAATQMCTAAGVIPPWRSNPTERLALYEAFTYYPGDDEHPRFGNLVDDNVLPVTLIRPTGSWCSVVVTVIEISADLSLQHSFWTATPQHHSVEFSGPHPTQHDAWTTNAQQHAA